MLRSKQLLQQAAQSAKAARLIIEKADAEGRSRTASEEAEVQRLAAEAKSLHEEGQRVAQADEDILAQMKRLGELTAGGSLHHVNPVGAPGDAASLAMKSWGTLAAKTIGRVRHEIGVKALTSGTVGVPAPMLGVTRFGERPSTLLDLIPTQRITGNLFSYQQQTVRTNNAAVVADLATKPTSTYTMREVEDKVRVIAHLSEPVPERFFADDVELERFLQAEMLYGLTKALEQEIATGSGTGEHFTGLTNTSGAVAQTFSTNIVTTCRKAVTAMQSAGENPTAWVFNPADAEKLDLIVDGSSRYLLGDPSAPSGQQSLWNLPRVTSHAVPAGTGILADWTNTLLVVREDAELAFDRSGDNFAKNAVVTRLEGRYGFGVRRPSSVALVALA